MADIRTVGPNPLPGSIERWGVQAYADRFVENDMPCVVGELDTLEQRLPEGWTPHAVIVIAGNQPLYRTRPWPWPTVHLSIDTWQVFSDYESAWTGDFTFVAQREFIAPMADTGAPRVQWLPLAADPEVHHPVAVPVTGDIGFVGSVDALVHRERPRIIELLRSAFRVRVDSRVFFDDYLRALCATPIALNHSAVDELNMRVFEAMAAGRMLITNRAAARNGLLDIFRDGEHLVTYADDAELIDKTRHYVAHPEERDAIARAGLEAVIAAHTYDHRAANILATLREAGCLNRPAAASAPLQDARLTLLPAVPGHVVDLGATLPATRYALRAHHAQSFTGITGTDDTTAVTRRYDAVHPWPGPDTLRADTVILSAPASFPAGLDAQLAAAHGWLAGGGCVIARLPPVDDLAAWMHARGFHPTHQTISAEGSIVRAVRRTRRLKGILRDVAARYPVEDAAYQPGYIAALPEGF